MWEDLVAWWNGSEETPGTIPVVTAPVDVTLQTVNAPQSSSGGFMGLSVVELGVVTVLGVSLLRAVSK